MHLSPLSGETRSLSLCLRQMEDQTAATHQWSQATRSISGKWHSSAKSQSYNWSLELDGSWPQTQLKPHKAFVPHGWWTDNTHVSNKGPASKARLSLPVLCLVPCSSIRHDLSAWGLAPKRQSLLFQCVCASFPGCQLLFVSFVEKNRVYAQRRTYSPAQSKAPMTAALLLR